MSMCFFFFFFPSAKPVSTFFRPGQSFDEKHREWLISLLCFHTTFFRLYCPIARIPFPDVGRRFFLFNSIGASGANYIVTIATKPSRLTMASAGICWLVPLQG